MVNETLVRSLDLITTESKMQAKQIIELLIDNHELDGEISTTKEETLNTLRNLVRDIDAEIGILENRHDEVNRSQYSIIMDASST